MCSIKTERENSDGESLMEIMKNFISKSKSIAVALWSNPLFLIGNERWLESNHSNERLI